MLFPPITYIWQTREKDTVIFFFIFSINSCKKNHKGYVPKREENTWFHPNFMLIF